MLVLRNRRAVIEWAGRAHAYPVLVSEGVDLSRHGADPAGSRRAGWEAFFDVLEGRRLTVVVESLDGFDHRILEKARARAELPAEAFGPPWYRRLWHEIALR